MRNRIKFKIGKQCQRALKKEVIRKMKPNILVIGLAIALVVMISGCIDQTQLGQQETGQQTTEPATTGTAQPAVTTIRETAYESGDLAFAEFPTVKTAELGVGRYDIYFEADSSVRFVVYAKDRYEEWKASGVHTISKATTKQGTSCCAESGTFRVDINEGEAGTYYLVFDASEVSTQPSAGKIVITQVGEI